MAGHSHWHNIRFKKEKQDLKKSKNNQKFSKEITNAVLSKASEMRLKSIVQTAKNNGVPNDVIERAINKGQNAGANATEHVQYEIFFPGGFAIIANGLSENISNSSVKIKESTNKSGGNIGVCSHLFQKEGLIILKNSDIDELMESIGDFIDDYDIDEENQLIIKCEVSNLNNIIKNLNSECIISSEEVYNAFEYLDINDLEEKSQKKLRKLLEDLENYDFIDEIYTNFNY